MRTRRRDTWVPPYRCIPPQKKYNAAPLAGRRAVSVHVWHRRRRVIFAAFTSGNREFSYWMAVRFVASATVFPFCMHLVVSVLLNLLPEEVIFVLTSNAVTPE